MLLKRIFFAFTFVLVTASLFCDSSFISPARAEPSIRIINGGPSGNKAIVPVLRHTKHYDSLCTGTLIAKSWVLTASHCVGSKASEIRTLINGKTYKTQKVYRHPRVYEDPYTGFLINDVALIRLKNSVKGVTPIPLLTSRATTEDDIIIIFGYGLDELGRYGAQLVGMMTLDLVTVDLLYATNRSLSQNDTCSGDSGGPAISGYIDGNGKSHAGIVGVISAGTQEDCGVGDVADFINIQSNTVLRFIASKVSGVTYQ